MAHSESSPAVASGQLYLPGLEGEPSFEPVSTGSGSQVSGRSLAEELADFCEFDQKTKILELACDGSVVVPVYVNEFWTARQRQASSLHEISYRACFKPQLPRFFIQRLARPGDSVYDPFMGRGTTVIESALLGRKPVGNDINPLSIYMCRPRLRPPLLAEVERRLREIPLDKPAELPEDLLAFFHPQVLRGVSSLKRYFAARKTMGLEDDADRWLAMVALNRLTGHSSGFFSAYTLPPNQAVSVKSQLKINERLGQQPPPRNIPAIILKKTRILLRDVDEAARAALGRAAQDALLLSDPADATPRINSDSVALVVTSPPFLNVVQYATDNWLRCWFMGIDPASVRLTAPRSINSWQEAISAVFRELHRVLRPGGHVAFEVGEVHAGKTRLEEVVVPCGIAAGLSPLLILINDQKFTKTANCWGVDNMQKGTNTNRVVVFRKD